MLSYFDSKDYNSYAHGLMMASVMIGYDTVFEYSRKLNIKWVDIASLRGIDVHRSPPLTPEPDLLYFLFVCLAIAQSIVLYKCVKRIQKTEITWQDGIKGVFQTFFAYLSAFIFAVIFFPPFLRFIRGW